MLLIELTTLTTSSRAQDLGILIDKDDFVKCTTFIDVNKITHIRENTDNKELTNIYLTSGKHVITNIKAKELVLYLQNYATPID